MKDILARIQDGTFAREWIEENRKGGKNFATLREKEKRHQIEEVGARLRGMMSWLPQDRTKSTTQPSDAKEAQAVNASGSSNRPALLAGRRRRLGVRLPRRRHH